MGRDFSRRLGGGRRVNERKGGFYIFISKLSIYVAKNGVFYIYGGRGGGDTLMRIIQYIKLFTKAKGRTCCPLEKFTSALVNA